MSHPSLVYSNKQTQQSQSVERIKFNEQNSNNIINNKTNYTIKKNKD